MEYRLLGRSGVRVSVFGFGAMMFGAWGDTDESDCVAMVDRALDAGINLFDTADVYDQGHSEEILGRALKGRRDDVVLSSKAFNPMGDDVNRRGGSRRWLTRAVEDSLRRLGTDHLDVYHLHRIDHDTDLDDTIEAMSDLVRAGKVRMIGTSSFPAEWLVEAQWAAERRGAVRPRVEQPPYSIFVRGIERDVLPTCRRHGIGTIVWSPLNGGWLTGKYRRGAPPDAASRAVREADHFDWDTGSVKIDAVEALVELAAETGTSLPGLATGFVLGHPDVSSALIGPRTVSQLDDLLAVADVRLDDEVSDRIDGIVAPGTDLNPADRQYDPPGLSPTARREGEASQRTHPDGNPTK